MGLKIGGAYKFARVTERVLEDWVNERERLSGEIPTHQPVLRGVISFSHRANQRPPFRGARGHFRSRVSDSCWRPSVMRTTRGATFSPEYREYNLPGRPVAAE